MFKLRIEITLLIQYGNNNNNNFIIMIIIDIWFGCPNTQHTEEIINDVWMMMMMMIIFQ